jgi:hypothetical protein
VERRRARRAAGSRTRSTEAAAIVIGICVICFSSASIAETISPACPERPASASKARGVAKEWFRKAETLVKEELFTEALGAFNCSLRMFEHPATMMNAARAAELADNKPEALDLYKRAVAATPEAEKATFAQARVAALEAELAKAPPAEKPEPEVRPEPKPEPEVKPEPKPEPEVKPEPEPKGDDGSPLLVPGYVALAVGGAGVVTGAVLAGLAAKAKKDGEDTDSWPEFQDKRDALAGLQTGAIVCFAVGGAALVAGIVMVAVGNKGEEPNGDAAAVEVAVYPGIGGLVVGGTF